MRKLPELNNTYYAMRHGRSVPNERKLIVSDPRNGVMPEYGLVDEGIVQAKESAHRSGFDDDTIIVSSNFSRARQTAEILAETVGVDEVVVDDRIRERGFGDMELQSADLYREVWSRDRKSATHTYRGAESLCGVAERQAGLIAELEKKLAGRVIVLVGHADPINVLKVTLLGQSLRIHRKAHSIANAEIQQLSASLSR